jgi:hypothetical protein
MDPQVNTSFIPKAALTAEKARSGGIGLFLLISILIFILSIIAAGGAFAYTGILNSNLAKNKADLAQQQGAFDPATIQELLKLDSRIEQGKLLLNKHVASSALFNFLSQNTLVNVQFSSFNYLLNADGTATVQLEGSADSFSTIALQSDALGKSSALKDVVFSGIAVDTSNRVTFTVNATVDPSLISYSKQQAVAPATP